MKTSFGSLLATLTLLAGCTGQEPLSPSAARLASSGYDGTARTVEGEVGGARYRTSSTGRMGTRPSTTARPSIRRPSFRSRSSTRSTPAWIGFTATPDALNYLRHYYDPTGRISVPVLTLSNRLDPVSAPFHQATYTGLAAAAGASDLLMQRSSVNLYGHCNLTTSEMVQAFMDLAAWASTGTKPGV